jgi:hypothetical protein
VALVKVHQYYLRVKLVLLNTFEKMVMVQVAGKQWQQVVVA